MNQNKNKKSVQGVSVPPAVPKSKSKKGKKAAKPSYSSNPVQEWTNMILNPYSSTVVKSPATTSILCSKTRIIESRDISYADTLNGYFSVIVRPALVYPLMIAKSPQRFPAAGSTEIMGSTINLVYSNTGSDPGFPISGQIAYKAGGSSILSAASPIADAALTTHLGFEALITIGLNWTATVQNTGKTEHYVQLYFRQEGVNWNAQGSAVLCSPGGSVSVVNGNPATNRSAFSLAICKKDGTLANPDTEYTGLILTTSFFGYIPVGTTGGSIYEFVKRSIVDTAGVEGCRVTAASMLASSMAAATKDGGELVIANTKQSTVYSANSTATLMSTLKALPEGNRWHSGIMRDGGYSFYVPDDMSSYEPHSYTTVNYDDNCVVAAGKLDEGGSIRIIATYIVEFYTKSQLFERSMGPTWTDQYKMAHTLIQRGRMASGNEDHETMVKRIGENVRKVWNWALENRGKLELGGEILMSLL